MLFTGHSEHTIDPKLRLAIPAKYRNQWDAARDGTAWICIPWPSGHLRLYTESSFALMASQGEMSVTPDESTSELEANLYGFAERLEMDTAGRISIPKSHLDMTGLGVPPPPTEVVIVGARNRLEVRKKSEWQSTAMDRFKSIPTLVQRVQQTRASFQQSHPLSPPLASPPRNPPGSAT